MKKQPEWRPITGQEDRSFWSFDEPLTEPMPPHKVWGANMNAHKNLPTKTGMIWMAVPWFFIFWKKLKFGLFDLILIVATLGSSMGAAISWFSAKKIPVLYMLVPLYLIVHVNCLAFSWLQYNQRFLSKTTQDSAWEKYWVRLIALGGVAAITHVLILGLNEGLNAIVQRNFPQFYGLESHLLTYTMGTVANGLETAHEGSESATESGRAAGWRECLGCRRKRFNGRPAHF